VLGVSSSASEDHHCYMEMFLEELDGALKEEKHVYAVS
jgi:hypothetical protein